MAWGCGGPGGLGVAVGSRLLRRRGRGAVGVTGGGSVLWGMHLHCKGAAGVGCRAQCEGVPASEKGHTGSDHARHAKLCCILA